VDTGDQLDVDAVAGRIVLRPLKPATAAGSPAGDELLPATVAPEPTPAAAPALSAKRGPGRPRKTAAAPLAASSVLPPRLKARGAKRKAATADETPR
jgi:hypothetical protein